MLESALDDLSDDACSTANEREHLSGLEAALNDVDVEPTNTVPGALVSFLIADGAIRNDAALDAALEDLSDDEVTQHDIGLPPSLLQEESVLQLAHFSRCYDIDSGRSC